MPINSYRSLLKAKRITVFFSSKNRLSITFYCIQFQKSSEAVVFFTSFWELKWSHGWIVHLFFPKRERKGNKKSIIISQIDENRTSWYQHGVFVLIASNETQSGITGFDQFKNDRSNGWWWSMLKHVDYYFDTKFNCFPLPPSRNEINWFIHREPTNNNNNNRRRKIKRANTFVFIEGNKNTRKAEVISQMWNEPLSRLFSFPLQSSTRISNVYILDVSNVYYSTSGGCGRGRERGCIFYPKYIKKTENISFYI